MAGRNGSAYATPCSGGSLAVELRVELRALRVERLQLLELGVVRVDVGVELHAIRLEGVLAGEEIPRFVGINSLIAIPAVIWFCWPSRPWAAGRIAPIEVAALQQRA